jgi:hypothetical protein
MEKPRGAQSFFPPSPPSNRYYELEITALFIGLGGKRGNSRDVKSRNSYKHQLIREIPLIVVVWLRPFKNNGSLLKIFK